MKFNKAQISIAILVLLLAGVAIGKFWTSTQSKTNSLATPTEHVASPQQTTTSSANVTDDIPQKAYTIWNYVKTNHKAPAGYVGGREFKNRERQLETKNKSGKKMRYQEWDVNPKKSGQNRGAERLVTSHDDRAWYTNNHYQSFQQLNPNK